MLRLPVRPLLHLSSARGAQVVSQVRQSGSGRANLSVTEEELQVARKWLEALHAETIPKTVGELSFSRSSGPGGQNVNNALHGDIRSSRHVAARLNALIIQADDSRKQGDNAQSCYKRLYEAIVEAGRHAIPGETSAEQAQRVKKLQKSDNQRRLKSKKQHSSKKSSRRSGRAD